MTWTEVSEPYRTVIWMVQKLMKYVYFYIMYYLLFSKNLWVILTKLINAYLLRNMSWFENIFWNLFISISTCSLNSVDISFINKRLILKFNIFNLKIYKSVFYMLLTFQFDCYFLIEFPVNYFVIFIIFKYFIKTQ